MSIAAVIDRMTQLRKEFAPYDHRLFFHDTYLRTTQAVAQELGKGLFVDPEWVEEWDVVFADLYVDALRAHLAGSRTPPSWAFAFDAALHRQLPPLRHVLLGMNAHINNDLPQALLAAVSSSDFDDPALIARREQDHRNIDALLLARVAAEDAELSAISAPSLSDRLLRPFNQRGTKHFLVEARRKVWRNATLLDHARRIDNSALASRIAELESRSADKVAELLSSGPVLLRLAVKGFGVTLAD